MTDTPNCILCPDRERIPNRAPVCDACRSWLAGMLGDIRIRYEQLVGPADPVGDDRTGVIRRTHYTDGLLRDAPTVEIPGYRDPTSHALPAALIPSAPAWSHTRRVPESHPPLPLDPIDLTLPARPGSRAPYVRALLDGEPTGSLSVATVLQTWVRDWVSVRTLAEHEPVPTVDALTRWLADRVEWACDEHPAVDEFADEMRQVRASLLGVLGLRDWPERKDAPCPKCDTRDLIIRNGSAWVECGSCDSLMSPDEYADWMETLVAQQNQAA